MHRAAHISLLRPHSFWQRPVLGCEKWPFFVASSAVMYVQQSKYTQLMGFCSSPQTSHHFWKSIAFPSSTNSEGWEDHSQHTEVYDSRIISSPPANKFKKGFDLRESSMDMLPSPIYVRKSPSGSWRWNTMFSNTRCLFGLELPCSAITPSFCKWMTENVFFIFKYCPLQVAFKDSLRYLIYTLISLR